MVTSIYKNQRLAFLGAFLGHFAKIQEPTSLKFDTSYAYVLNFDFEIWSKKGHFALGTICQPLVTQILENQCLTLGNANFDHFQNFQR